jgi:phosphocarrier protein
MASLQEREPAGRDAESGSALKLEVLVRNEQGIHARPAAKLAQEAQKFVSEIKLVYGKQTVDAKSILDILTLAAAQGSEISIEAEGQDAEQAVDHLRQLFECRLGEER